MARNKQNIGGGGHLPKINRLAKSVMGSAKGVTLVNQKSDFGVAVDGKIRVIDDEHYILNAVIDLGSDVLEGASVIISGDRTPKTLLFTNSASAMISSVGDGVIQLVDLVAANISGPLVSADLGAIINRSVLFLDTVIYTGDLLGNGTGLGTIGDVQDADLVVINNCAFLDVVDGIKFAGVINDISMVNTSITARNTAPAFTAVEVLASAELDITALSSMRFATRNAADRCVKFSSSATYGSPIRVSNSTIRGPGTFVQATGLQKTDPDFIATDNEGNTAPVDSQFAGNASFHANTVETVIDTIGVPVPIGNGNPSHPLFNSGAFVERFSLDGAETQLQKFVYTARAPGTYAIDLHTQLTRAGGGIVIVELSVKVNDVLVLDSLTETEVGNSSTPGYTSTTAQLTEGDEVTLEVANNTTTANLIVNSAAWRINKL